MDRYEFTQEYPSPGDGTAAMLYLRQIAPYGWDAANPPWVAGPVTRFDSYGSLYDNRVDYNVSQGVPPLKKWRVNAITNGIGGETWVYYSPQDCSPIPEGRRTTTRSGVFRSGRPMATTAAGDGFTSMWSPLCWIGI